MNKKIDEYKGYIILILSIILIVPYIFNINNASVKIEDAQVLLISVSAFFFSYSELLASAIYSGQCYEYHLRDCNLHINDELRKILYRIIEITSISIFIGLSLIVLKVMGQYEILYKVLIIAILTRIIVQIIYTYDSYRLHNKLIDKVSKVDFIKKMVNTIVLVCKFFRVVTLGISIILVLVFLLSYTIPNNILYDMWLNIIEKGTIEEFFSQYSTIAGAAMGMFVLGINNIKE